MHKIAIKEHSFIDHFITNTVFYDVYEETWKAYHKLCIENGYELHLYLISNGDIQLFLYNEEINSKIRSEEPFSIYAFRENLDIFLQKVAKEI
jgi:hypothetical protein